MAARSSTAHSAMVATKRPVGLLMAALLISGCFQRLLPIRALETKQGVAFELPEVARGLSSERRYELLDLMVTKRGCSSDCTLWSVVRAAGAGSVYLKRAQIAYGEQLAGTVVRESARELTPERYAVSATVQEYGVHGELVRSLTMDSEFEIQRDGAGKLRVAGGARSNETGGCQ